jgi:hypothetical protein
VSAAARIATRYRRYSSDQLRATRPAIRNPRCQAAIDIVLTERQDAYQAAFDATQVVLDAIGGQDAPSLHARALGAAMRHTEVQEWLEAERAMGVADALWDYCRERSDA